jgi:hypothetical protein
MAKKEQTVKKETKTAVKKETSTAAKKTKTATKTTKETFAESVEFVVNPSVDTDLSVEQKLGNLYKLQSMLSEIDKIKTLRGELPLEVQDLEDEVAGLQTRIQNFQLDSKDIDTAIGQQRIKITDSNSSINKYK